MKIKILNYDNFVFTCNYLDNPKKISGEIKKALTRKKINIESFLHEVNATPRMKCGFCNRETILFDISFEVARREKEEADIIVTGIKHISDLKYCYIKGCEGKKLNPNSIEFICKTRDISKEEAIQYIHARNKSPFYRDNHKTEEDYQKYQNIFLRLKDSHDLQNIIDKQNFSRSLQGYIERFGEDGETKWKIVQSQKAISLDNYMRMGFLKEESLRRYNQWVKKSRNNLSNFVRRYGEEKGLHRYNEFYEKMRKNFKNKGAIEYKGIVFDSGWDLQFYKKAIENDLIFKYDMCYPNSMMRCDFYFPLIDTYVEICGQYWREGYKEKIDFKQKTFGCIVINDPKDFDNYITYIKQLHETR